MLPAPSSLITYPDAYVATRPTVMSAREGGKLLGQKAAAGELHVFLTCWWEVAGRRISAGVVRLLPAAWSDDFRNNSATWFDGDVFQSSAGVAQLLREAELSGLGLTPEALRNMCWGPIQLHTKDRECVWVQAAFDPDELARALSPPTPNDQLVRRMVELLLDPQSKKSFKNDAELYAKAAAQRSRLTVRTEDDRAGQADVPASSGRAGRKLIKRAKQLAQSRRSSA
jgi:hypothetical protein